MEEQLKEHSRVIDRRIEEQSRAVAKRFEDSDKRFEEMMKMMREFAVHRINDGKSPESSHRSESGRVDATGGGNVSNRNLGYTPKIAFPKFDGSSSRTWIKKCVKNFSLCKIPEEQKVDLASLHMTDKAEVWVSNYLAIKKNVDWSEFVIDLSARFKDEIGLSVVEQFNKLQQTGSIEDYIDEFDNLRSLMEQFQHVLPDA